MERASSRLRSPRMTTPTTTEKRSRTLDGELCLPGEGPSPAKRTVSDKVSPSTDLRHLGRDAAHVLAGLGASGDGHESVRIETPPSSAPPFGAHSGPDSPASCTRDAVQTHSDDRPRRRRRKRTPVVPVGGTAPSLPWRWHPSVPTAVAGSNDLRRRRGRPSRLSRLEGNGSSQCAADAMTPQPNDEHRIVWLCMARSACRAATTPRGRSAQYYHYCGTEVTQGSCELGERHYVSQHNYMRNIQDHADKCGHDYARLCSCQFVRCDHQPNPCQCTNLKHVDPCVRVPTLHACLPRKDTQS